MPIDDIFTHFPYLETEHLLLRQIQPTDADALFAFFSDEEVIEQSNKRHRSVKDSQAFIRQLQKWYQKHENIEWGITRKGEDILIGTCGFYSFDEGLQRADTGYELHRAYWRQGIMSEALTAILTFAFTTMGLHRVNAVVYEWNERSQGLLRKLGFVHELSFSESYFFRDRYWDELHFSLLKNEWNLL